MSVGWDGLPQLVTVQTASTVQLLVSVLTITSHCKVRCWRQWKLSTFFTLTYCHTNCLRGSVVSDLAQWNIWRKAQKAFWTIHLFTDDTKWCEAKVQTSTNISFCWVFKAIKVTRTVSVWQSSMGNVSLFFFTAKWNVRVVFYVESEAG